MRGGFPIVMMALLGCPSAEKPVVPSDVSDSEPVDSGEESPSDEDGDGNDDAVDDGGESTGSDSSEPVPEDDSGGSDDGDTGVTEGSDTAEDSAEPPLDIDITTLRGAAESSGRRVGVAISSSAMRSDPEYLAILVSEFGGITPENATKWGPLQPSEGVWDFEKPDEMIELATTEDLRVKGHALLWHNQVPSWIDGSIDATTLEGLMDDHFRETLEHFSSDVPDWDVVNEAFEWSGAYRESMFWDLFGPSYIAAAFQRAAAHAPEARLFYNDYNIEGVNAKSNAVVEMVEDFRRDGIPIHGVGMQMHLVHGLSPTRADLKANMERLGDLGLVVHISEMDVQIRGLVGANSERLLAQAMTYYEVTAACVESSACEQLGFWGFTDRYSWIDSWFGEDDPLLYDEGLAPKPAREAVHAALLGEPMSGCEDSRVDNGGFEADLEGWDAMGSTLTIVDEPTYAGDHAVLSSDRTEAWQGPRQSILEKISTGLRYEAKAWARLAGGDPTTVKLTLHWADDWGDHWVQFATTEVGSGEWTELSGVIDFGVISVVGTLTEAHVYVEGPAAGVGLYVDELSLHPVCPTTAAVIAR